MEGILGKVFSILAVLVIVAFVIFGNLVPSIDDKGSDISDSITNTQVETPAHD